MNITNIDLRQLRYFVTVAEELNFTRAAERLHMSQPPLSHQIRLLEENLNVKLFHRTKREVRLTEAGAYLLKAANKLLRGAQDALTQTQAAARGQIGELRIGINFSAPLNPQFPRLIARYRQHYPGVRLIFKEIFYIDGIKAVYNEELDACFTRPDDLQSKGKLRYQVFSEDDLKLCMPRTHHLAKKQRITIADLKNELFILSPRQARTPLCDTLQELAQKAGFYLRISQDTGHYPVMINLAAAGYGVTFVPPSIKYLARREVVFKNLTGLKPDVCRQPLTIAYCATNKSLSLENFLAMARS